MLRGGSERQSLQKSRQDAAAAIRIIQASTPSPEQVKEEGQRAAAEAKKKAAVAKKKADTEAAEQRAAAYLRYAKKLADEGMLDKARERLNEIASDFPDTEAATEAKRLLDKLKKEGR